MITQEQLLKINPGFASLLQRAQQVATQYPVRRPAPSSPAPAPTGSIAAGTVGPGGARFGMGAGGANRFDHTQYGGGLWSIGIDPNSPTAKADAQRWYDSQPANVRAEVQKGMGNQPGRGSIDPMVYAVDWRARDVARKIKKTNGFMDSTLGKILGTALPIAAGFIPGIGTAAQIGLGAALGGAQGGVKGALLGAAASAVGPSIKLPGGISAAVRAPITTARAVAPQILNPTALSRFIASRGFGAAMPQRRA